MFRLTQRCDNGWMIHVVTVVNGVPHSRAAESRLTMEEMELNIPDKFDHGSIMSYVIDDELTAHRYLKMYRLHNPGMFLQQCVDEKWKFI